MFSEYLSGTKKNYILNVNNNTNTIDFRNNSRGIDSKYLSPSVNRRFQKKIFFPRFS